MNVDLEALNLIKIIVFLFLFLFVDRLFSFWTKMHEWTSVI